MKNNFWKGAGVGILVSIVILGLVLWFIFQVILGIFGNTLLFFSSGAPTDKKDAVSCENGYQIKQEAKTSYAFLGGQTIKTETLLIKNSIERKIFAVNSDIKLPIIPKLREEFAKKVTVKDIDPKLNKLTDSAGFIQAEKSNTASSSSNQTVFSKIEFEIIVNCLSKNYTKFAYLPNTLVYGDKKYVEIDFYDQTVFRCPQKDKILIDFDGHVGYFIAESSLNRSDLDLGFFGNKFERSVGKIIKVNSSVEVPNYLREEYDPNKNELIEIKTFYLEKNKIEQGSSKKILIPRKITTQFFDENGVKNDYLQTCKNSEGKTIFEIFKTQ